MWVHLRKAAACSSQNLKLLKLTNCQASCIHVPVEPQLPPQQQHTVVLGLEPGQGPGALPEGAVLLLS